MIKDRTLVYVVLIVCIFFVTKWTFQGAYFLKDLVINTIPLENLYGQIQRAGQSPLWAPELAGGYPLLASAQLDFWYPPHMILRQFLPGVWTLNISLLLHALLAAIGTFLFLKYNKLTSIAAGMAAVLFPFGATFVGKYSSLNLVLPFMWAPLLFLLLQLFMEQGRLKYFTMWVGATALCILVGHPQMALYVLMSEVLFIGCLTAYSWDRWKRAVGAQLGIVLAIAMCSFYLLPIIYNIPDTDRATGTLHANAVGMFDYQFTPKAFLGLVLPHPFGHDGAYRGPTNESELSSYLGPIVVLLAFLGICTSRRKFPAVWLVSVVLIVVGLTLAIGGYSPVFRWLVAHGFNYFNAPSRFFFYVDIGLVFFAAAGLDFFRSFAKPWLALAAVLPVLWVGWGWHQGVPWEFTQEPAMVRLLQGQGFARIFSGDTIAENAPDNDFGIKAYNLICDTCVYRQTFVSPFDRINGIAIQVASVHIGTGTLKLTLYDGSGKKLREAIIGNKDLVDSQWNTVPFQVVEHAQGQSFYFEIRSDMPRIQAPRLLIHTNPNQQYDPSGRLYNCIKAGCLEVKNYDAAFKIIASSQAVSYYDALAPYVSAGFGIGTMQWAGSLPIGVVKEYLKPLGTWGDPWGPGARAIINRFATTHFIGIFPPYRYAESLNGTSYISSVPIGDQFLRLYRNDEAFPRVQFVQTVKALSDTTDQINTIMKLPATDQKTVVADVPSDAVFSLSGNAAHLIQDGRTKVIIQTQQDSDGFLVLRDLLLKDWTATIDGHPAHIYRVDGLFRGIEVSAGSHVISFEYKPRWIGLAVWSLGISLSIFLILAWISIKKKTGR
ncbi:MAG: hypothetical protein K8Q97_04025 [Candidatus Andersenbacteria bacterium]|nr:hypothetical protein [Candidatus Andersenbacteria bacterium]